MNNEKSILKKLESWSAAVKLQDIDQIASHYADSLRVFDAVGPLQITGRGEYVEHWQQCLSTCTISVFDSAEPVVEVEGSLAVCSFLNKCGSTGESGEEEASWFRVTQVYRKINNDWKIVHEHFSVPFHMDTGEAQFDLLPEIKPTVS